MATKTLIEVQKRPTENDGWRSGKPIEDPNKTKRWGLVTARPSEFLVHMRGGRVRTSSSGQAATCFKWPWDAVAIVPTSLQRLSFQADQVTIEHIGVQVVGLAVYRIADPLLAFRVLNFSYPERAQQKLEETLTAMFVGAARRLIANLRLEQCLQKRKEALAQELIKEVAPIVGGIGSPLDDTQRGWGVIIDTIEIQEVRVMSEKVFAAMQAPYRALLEQRASQAKATSAKEMALAEAEHRRAIEEARIEAELQTRQKRTALETKQIEDDKQRAFLKMQTERDIEETRLQNERSAEEASASAAATVEAHRAELERLAHEQRTNNVIAVHALAAREAQAEIDAYELRQKAQVVHAELARAAWLLDSEKRRGEIALKREDGNVDGELHMLHARIDAVRAKASARIKTADNLPALAAAVGQRFGEVKITQIGNADSNPFGSIAQAVASVMALAKN